jgi:hypothetical protein
VIRFAERTIARGVFLPRAPCARACARETHHGAGDDLSNNLYKLWNRLSSGSYFPPPVRRADIPKADGGTRPLGIPTVADRIAQEVAGRYPKCCPNSVKPRMAGHFSRVPEGPASYLRIEAKFADALM